MSPSTASPLHKSSYLTEAQLSGLERAGRVLVPGGDGLPSFRETGCSGEADRMLAYLPEADRRSFASLMGLFRFLPIFVITLLLRLADRHRFFPGPLGAALRMIRFGVFGTVYTLYYADEGVLAKLGWDAAAGRDR
jgi:hypothetical protein